MQDIRIGYPELFQKLQKTKMCFIHDSNPDSIWEASPEQREELWEHLYAQPGFGIWLSNYKEILVDREANALISDFVAKKIRQRVHDPETAELLIPTNHGFGTRRVPMVSTDGRKVFQNVLNMGPTCGYLEPPEPSHAVKTLLTLLPFIFIGDILLRSI